MLGTQLLWTLAALWHTLAFAAGGVNVWLAWRSLFGAPSDPRRARVIRAAEWHLVASGLAIVVLGASLAGWGPYFADPKVWAKLAVVTVWLAAGWALRRVALPRLRAGDRRPMLWIGALSGACWLYGAFLGVAKPLSQGALPAAVLVAGFAGVVSACVGATLWCEAGRGRAGSGVKGAGGTS